MEIYLIRHTRVAPHSSICYGISDVDLAETFPDEAELVRGKLPEDLAPYIFYSSPLNRCRLLADSLSLSNYNIDERLIEFNFGNWELKSWADINRDELNSWIKDIANFPCPGGDILSIFTERCAAFFDEIVNSDSDRIAVVTHTGVIHAILARLLKMPVADMFMLQVDYGGVSKVSLNKGRVQVEYINR